MSNARLFCIGWVIALWVTWIADWLGVGPTDASSAKRALFGLTLGVIMVAFRGDRDRRQAAHPTHTNDRGES